jgi:hypothetical protein
MASMIWLLRIVVGLKSTHIRGTHVPVEEPSTASQGDIHVAAKHALTCRKSRGAKGSGVGFNPRRAAARRMNWVLIHAAFIRSDLASR